LARAWLSSPGGEQELIVIGVEEVEKATGYTAVDGEL
jgi:hypothetical protein